MGAVYQASTNSQFSRLNTLKMPTDNSNNKKKSTESSTTEAVIEFTTVSDNSHHRIRFDICENQLGMKRIHEVKSNQQWEIVESEVVDEISFSTGDCENTFPVLSNSQP